VNGIDGIVKHNRRLGGLFDLALLISAGIALYVFVWPMDAPAILPYLH